MDSSITWAMRELARGARTLAHPVEDDDGVVQRIADHREDGRDRREIEGDLRQREETHHADRIVQHGEDRAQREFGGEPEQHVDQDEHQRRHQGPARP